MYDEHAGLRHIVLASGAKHSVSCQPSIGFVRFTYTPPGNYFKLLYVHLDFKQILQLLTVLSLVGSTKSYLLHYTHAGKLLQIVYPGDGARVLYRYHPSGQLAEVIIILMFFKVKLFIIDLSNTDDTTMKRLILVNVFLLTKQKISVSHLDDVA